MVTTNRTREVAQFLALTRDWAGQRPDVEAVGLAGSWARGDARMNSDVDLVVLCSNPEPYLEDLYWAEELDYLTFILSREWGPLTEMRFQRPTGLEIEFGFAPPSWASTNPIDEGTLNVVLDGFSAIHDPHRIIHRLIRAANAQAGY
jgi:predicted nucleotidyltransferase